MTLIIYKYIFFLFMAVLFELQYGNHCSVSRGCMLVAIHLLVLYFTKDRSKISHAPSRCTGSGLAVVAVCTCVSVTGFQTVIN